MWPNPRRNHSCGEARSVFSSWLRVEEEKIRSLVSEKAQMVGSGAGVAVTARSSLPSEKDWVIWGPRRREQLTDDHMSEVVHVEIVLVIAEGV